MAALPADLLPPPSRVASFAPRRITVYVDRSACARDQIEPRETDKNLTRGIYNGYISPATRRHIRRTVGTWIRSVWAYRQQIKKRYDPGKPYPVFITLTLPSPQIHDDREINRRCLQPFLATLKRVHGITHYFWRAEAQENGNVHYHILTDRYIAARDLQASWNRAINVLGYEDRYFERSGKVDPPSTDVHRMTDQIKDKKTGKMVAVDPIEYLLDYVTDAAQPDEDDDPMMLSDPKPRVLRGKYRNSAGDLVEYIARPVLGRVWGMSDPVREIREPRAECTPAVWSSLSRAVDRGELRMHAMDHATLFFGPIHSVIKRSRGWLGDLINSYHLHVFRWLYPEAMPREWILKHGEHDASKLWICTLSRRLKEEPPVGISARTLDYEGEEPLLLTDLRRSFDPKKTTPAQRERLLILAREFYLT